jgi:hypothetical protein
VHRFVLLGEVTERYALNPSEPRYKQFFVWTVIYQLMISAPSLLLAGPADNVAATALSIPLFIIVIIVALRLIILFPAIAVDAPGTAWQNAVEDTKGHAWRIFWDCRAGVDTDAGGAVAASVAAGLAEADRHRGWIVLRRVAVGRERARHLRLCGGGFAAVRGVQQSPECAIQQAADPPGAAAILSL